MGMADSFLNQRTSRTVSLKKADSDSQYNRIKVFTFCAFEKKDLQKINLKVFGGVVSHGRTAPPPETAVVLNFEPESISRCHFFASSIFIWFTNSVPSLNEALFFSICFWNKEGFSFFLMRPFFRSFGDLV